MPSDRDRPSDWRRSAHTCRTVLRLFRLCGTTEARQWRPPERHPAVARDFVTFLRTRAFVLKAGETDATFVPLGRADTIENLIASWRVAMMTSLRPASVAPGTAPSFRSLGVMLRQRVWDPMAARLTGVNRVFVVPDGSLNLVSLAALPSGSSHYLVEDGPVLHYLSAERDVVPPEQPPSGRAAGLLTIGGPAFADGSSLARATPPAAAAPSIHVVPRRRF